MKKKLVTIFTICALSCTAFSFPVYAEDSDASRIEALEQKVTELEQRIAALEGFFSNSDDTDSVVSGSEEVLNPGVYVVGEDIPAGKYSFHITDGVGMIEAYGSYDAYKANDYNDYECYGAASETYKDSLDSDLESLNALYSSDIGNIPLQNGMCLNINGVTASYTVQ